MSDLEKQELKILMLGNSNAGKTTIINSYINGVCNPRIKPTISFDIHSKLITYNKNTEKINLTVKIWDISKCGDKN